jgi:hypothetical protein
MQETSQAETETQLWPAGYSSHPSITRNASHLTIRQRSGADQFAEQIATSEEGVPAVLFGGLVSPDLINAFATNRTKPNMNPITTVPYITEAGT